MKRERRVVLVIGFHQCLTWRILYLVATSYYVTVIQAMMACHDDPTFEPGNGLLSVVQFTWLGGLQYIHVKTGTPNYFRVPRVVLITKQFVIATAVDAARLPDGYALGNIIFGDYERDEDECGLSIDEVAKGAVCDPALLLMPIADVLLHPEYKHFKVKNSVALLRLISEVRSKYMLPACLPLKDFTRMANDDALKPDSIYHLDFTSDVPRDFAEEEKEILQISMLPKEMCYVLDERANATNIREGCSTHCGFRSGAPSIIHEHTGHWTVVALAQGGAPCPDPLRPVRSSLPAVHTLLHPYVPWITSAITGRSIVEVARSDPFGYIMPRTYLGIEDRLKLGWVGKWWMGGIRCYDRGEAADKLFRFYHEVFSIVPAIETYINYYIEIEAPWQVRIVCVKVGVPYRLGEPRLWDLDTPSVKIRIKLHRFYLPYRFEVEAWGYKRTGNTDELFGYEGDDSDT